jgi:hypothetical protein
MGRREELHSRSYRDRAAQVNMRSGVEQNADIDEGVAVQGDVVTADKSHVREDASPPDINAAQPQKAGSNPRGKDGARGHGVEPGEPQGVHRVRRPRLGREFATAMAGSRGIVT